MVNKTPGGAMLCIVQAKRYSKAVGVSHIRELAGAMEEKRAGHGILVTTSWFTSGCWQKACLTPTYSSWANPIEAQFGPLRTFMRPVTGTETTHSEEVTIPALSA